MLQFRQDRSPVIWLTQSLRAMGYILTGFSILSPPCSRLNGQWKMTGPQAMLFPTQRTCPLPSPGQCLPSGYSAETFGVQSLGELFQVEKISKSHLATLSAQSRGNSGSRKPCLALSVSGWGISKPLWAVWYFSESHTAPGHVELQQFCPEPACLPPWQEHPEGDWSSLKAGSVTWTTEGFSLPQRHGCF